MNIQTLDCYENKINLKKVKKLFPFEIVIVIYAPAGNDNVRTSISYQAGRSAVW